MKSILRQILQGTRFLHERGILHRDLKPSNLIVSLPPTGVPPTTNAATDMDETPATSTSFSGDSRESSPAKATTPVTAARGRRWWEEGSTSSKRRRRGGGGRGARGGAGTGNEQGSSSRTSSPVLLRVADFSSAVDEGAIAAGLYGTRGPAQGEETLQYAPPEVLFNPEVCIFCKRVLHYA